MDDTIRRTLPRRGTVGYKRKVKPVYNFKILKKVLRQLIISGVILILILSLKNINTPFTNLVIEKIYNFLHNSFDYHKSYQVINGFLKEFTELSNILLRLPVKPQQVNPKMNNISKISNSQNTSNIPVINKETPKQVLSPNNTKKLPFIVSSINSSEADAKYIRSNFKLALPLDGFVSSGFGFRIHPVAGVEEFHNGIDIAANQGTPIYAALSGKVVEARKEELLGNFIKILSGKDIITIYAHCYKLYVKPEQNVVCGQKIAEVGNTGLSNGPHLHFQISRSGRLIDPAYLFSRYRTVE